MAKKGILVHLNQGGTPLVFVVPGEAVTFEQEEKLERLIELYFSTEFDLIQVQEVANLEDLHNMIIRDHGEAGKQYPKFSDEVTAEEGGKLMNLSPDGYKIFMERHKRRMQEEDKSLSLRIGAALKYKPTFNMRGVTTGRMSSSDTRLANLPQSDKPLKTGFTGERFNGFDVQAIKESLIEKLMDPKALDFTPHEKRITAALLRGNLLGVIGDYAFFEGETGRLTASGPNIQEQPKTVKVPKGHHIPTTWEQCSPECPGWLHMNEPYEVEECDECGRFKDPNISGLMIHLLAVDAHKAECGCGWPEFDYQNAAMAWANDIKLDIGDITEAEVEELKDLLDARGTEFMDNVTPAIYVTSRLREKVKDVRNRVPIDGLRKLLKKVQGMIENEQLKLKDFGEPPGGE